MSLSRTLRASASVTSQTVTTSSFTPSNNSLLVAIMGAEKEDAPDIEELPSMGITDSAGLTWTLRASRGDDTAHIVGGFDHWPYAPGLKIWTAPVATGVSMTVTFLRVSPNAYTMRTVMGAVIEYTGYNVASPVGVIGSTNWDNGNADGSVDGAKSLTLSGSPAATSEIIGARTAVTVSADNCFAVPATGITELYDICIYAEMGLQIQARAPGSTSTTFGWDDVAVGSLAYCPGACAIEIKEAAATGTDITGTSATVTVTASSATITATTAITGTPAVIVVQSSSGTISATTALIGTSAIVTIQAGTGVIQLPVAITGISATVTVQAGSATVAGHAAIIGTSATVIITAGSAVITATTAITGTPATVTVTAATGEIGINAPDPVKIADRGIRTSTATGNGTITITNPTLITVGNYLVARVAVDNSGASGARPGLVFSDTRNGTWSQGTGGLQDPGAVSAGVAVYLCYVKVAVAYQAGDVFSFAWTTGTPISAIVVEEWANIRQTTPLSVAEVSANNVSSTAQPSISRTPLAVGELVYVAAALEGISSSWGAQDADTTGGSWGDVTKDQANTGTATTSVSIYGGYKIVTSTAAQTWNNTLGVTSDWAAVAVVFAKNIPPTNVTGTPGWVTVTAGSAVVAGGAAVVGTSAIVSVQAGSAILTAGTNVTGTSATISVQAGSGVIQFPTTNITGTSATVAVTAGSGTITGQTNITGTSSVVTVTASTATITGQTNITGTSATVVVTASTGNITSQINITGTSATVVVTAGTGIVGTILTIVGTSATVAVTAGTGTITGQTNITGTPATVTVIAGSAVLIGSVIGTSATVIIIGGSGVITAHTAITGTPATVAITAGTAPILTGSNILGTSAIVSVIAGIGAITAQTNIIGLSAIIAVISGVGTITGQANTIGVSAIIAVNAGTGQITAAGSYVLPAKQGAILVV